MQLSWNIFFQIDDTIVLNYFLLNIVISSAWMREIDVNFFAISFIFLIAKLNGKYCLTDKDYDFLQNWQRLQKLFDNCKISVLTLDALKFVQVQILCFFRWFIKHWEWNWVLFQNQCTSLKNFFISWSMLDLNFNLI